MMATPNSTTSNQLARSNKRASEAAVDGANDEPAAKRPYYGKCQYKTGKCFNERTLKRNGDAHSLCEEHRIKQNLIQRRSDRKYQTVHAIRRRERSQRRAVLKKQVSMAVAQQLFYEHQQQKTLGIPLPQHHPLHLLAAGSNSATPTSGLAPPIQVPTTTPPFLLDATTGLDSSMMTLFQQPLTTEAVSIPTTSYHKTAAVLQAASATTGDKEDESTPTGIDDFTPDSFLNIPIPTGALAMPDLKDEEVDDSTSLSCNFGYMPIVPCGAERETWSDDDIEFLQTILLA